MAGLFLFLYVPTFSPGLSLCDGEVREGGGATAGTLREAESIWNSEVLISPFIIESPALTWHLNSHTEATFKQNSGNVVTLFFSTEYMCWLSDF